MAQALGYTPVYLRYNTGLHTSTNGAELSGQLESLVAAWPVPATEVAVLAHSMGGLVARSAIAQARGRPWPARLQALITLGTPHGGAPLERGGQMLQQLLALSAYSRPLATLAARRSAGIRDLRHASLLEADADAGRASRMPLTEGVACYAVAATTASQPSGPPARWLGDGLVPVASALGRHRDPARRLTFTDTAIVAALGHLG
uniref:PGAP1-like alpha/beta domain-containing protein n=1 Tax=Escherichia coli TaxID=562 RepID=UPI00192A2126